MTSCALVPASKAATLDTAVDVYREAVDLLLDLPRYPAEIANMFYDIGISGVRVAARSCPLATYLQNMISPEQGIEVGILNGGLHVKFGRSDLIWSLPHHLDDFVKRFDNGDYPLITRVRVP